MENTSLNANMNLNLTAWILRQSASFLFYGAGWKTWTVSENGLSWSAADKDGRNLARFSFRPAWPPEIKSFVPSEQIAMSYEPLMHHDEPVRRRTDDLAIKIGRRLLLLEKRLNVMVEAMFPRNEEGMVVWSASPLLSKNQEQASTETIMLMKFADLPCELGCVFCSRSRWKPQEKPPWLVYMDQLFRAAIRMKRPKDQWSYAMIGGNEPLLHPYLFDFITLAYSRGYRDIRLQTSAAKRLDLAMIEKLAKAGVRMVELPLYSLESLTHDAIVQSEGHFAASIYALDALVKSGIEVAVHCVLLQSNIENLEHLPEFVKNRGARFAGFIYPRNEDKTCELYFRLAPKLSTLPLILRKELDLYIPCLRVGKRNIDKSERRTEQELVDSRGKGSEDSRSSEYARVCCACLFRDECSGVYKGYLDIFGEDEFKAATVASDT